MTEPVVLIAGGVGKDQDFSPLLDPVVQHARAVVLIGRDAAKIETVLAGHGVPLVHAASMQDAVQRAAELAEAGDAVLLSPACASFDMFENYKQRGRIFAACVAALRVDRGAALMLYAPNRPMSEVDLSLLWSTVVLLAIGLVMVYSASIATAEMAKITGYRSHYYLMRHGMFIVIGIVAALVAFQIPVAWLQRGAPYLFLFCILLLLLVLIPGIGRHGQRIAPLAAAGYHQLSAIGADEGRRGAVRRRLHRAQSGIHAGFQTGFLPMFVVMFIAGALLLREPDFGAFVVVTTIAMGILFLGGLNWRLFAGLIVLLLCAFVAAHPALSLPPAARTRLHGPVGGCLRQGLSALAFAHRVRTRRVVRRRAGRQRREAVLPAGSAHRFPAWP